MEKKINIAELLKDCPKGMELDCPMFENLEFDRIEEDNGLFPIECRVKTESGYNIHTFTKYGCYSTNNYAKCVIYPKGKTTWEGFVPPVEFKDGDIVFTMESINYGIWISIFKGNNEIGIVTYADFRVDSNLFYQSSPTILCPNYDIIIQRLATEEEKQKLFQAIKDNGYKWNAETKTLEKLIVPKFEIGNVIQDTDSYKVKIIEVNIEEGFYVYESIIAKGIGSIGFNEQDNWKLVPNKFDITTLKAFESRVLVRDYDNQIWIPTFWGKRLEDDSNCSYLTTNGCYKYCIPYEHNQHLLGTTNDCDEFYKTW